MKKLFTIILLAFVGFNEQQVIAQCTKLVDFAGTTNGSTPQGDLYYDGTYLYGMTYIGGANNSGIIFKVLPNGTGYIKLLDFAGTTNGSKPCGSLISDGIFLYGMTSRGGANGFGTVFKIMPNGTGYVDLFDFGGVSTGSSPFGSLAYDGTFLYGMTASGGTGIGSCGTIFKIKTDGTGYVKLLDFNGVATGGNPQGSLIYDGIFLYGLTGQGGANGKGTMFKINPNGTAFTKLWDFAGAGNGDSPYGSLVSDGTYLYGMDSKGGCNGLGCVYSINKNGTGFMNLYSFDGAAGGSNPWMGSLLYDGTYLYGMASNGGANGMGTIFKVTPLGNNYYKLLDFAGTTNGSNPLGSLISDGTFLYGMTQSGGVNGDGVVFKLGGVLSDITKINFDAPIRVYPNPANDIFTISANTSDKYTVDLYDVNGRHVFSKNVMDKEDINVAFLNEGVYSMTIKTADRVINKKLIILR